MSHHKDIFLDHASTTPVQPDVMGVMLSYFGNHFASPGAGYELGHRSRKALEQSRERIAKLLGAMPYELVFTSSGTESNNMAVLGAAYARQSDGKHIITSSIEHACVLKACMHLEHLGFRVTYLPVNENALIDVGALEDAICDDTILISIMHANNEVGTIQPIEEIGRIARKKGITFHCDAVQSAGKIPIDVRKLHVDLLSISSHKIYGPKGAGALYIRKETKIEPILFGSGQENGLHPGTHNVPAIVGFGMACQIAGRDLENNYIHIRALRESLEQQILDRIPGTRINGYNAGRLPHISNISFEGVLADSIGANLDADNIFVSTGPAFRSYGKVLSRVIVAMHVPPEFAYGTVRFSLGWENRNRDIKITVDTLEKCISSIRAFSGSDSTDKICIFTFPDKESAVSAGRIIATQGLPFTLTGKPEDIMQVPCSHIALACLNDDQPEIVTVLKEQGIEIAGIHKIDPQCETTVKKEQDFWVKVEEIKKERE
ncbi:MAG TPA: cysteine desulfurase [Deltaproteobacteria bacterium]|nr:cysteine desulfurase [Deltaproteobacteria bacterium]